ncbi:MAG: DUF4388 domain-containing protein [Planctomycetota bacterium]|jgi:hypothetical protein
MPDFAESLEESIPVVMRALAQASNSGVLRIRGKDAEAEFMFYKGEIMWARLSDGKRLGEALEERGAISSEHLAAALAVQKRKKQRQPFATILVELGLVDRAVISTELEVQVLEVLRQVFSWGGGEYSFEGVKVKEGVTPTFALPMNGKVDELLKGAGVNE